MSMFAPDLHAPRFRPKRVSLLNKKMYKKFLKAFPEYSDLTNEQFKEIIRTFNGLICQGIIDNRDGVELPEGLGFICMGTCPRPNKTNVDYAKSREVGKLVNHRNFASDNKLLKIFYTNHTAKYKFQNRQLWSFVAVKQFRQRASAAYKKNWTKYIVVEPGKKISERFQRAKNKHYADNHMNQVSDDYNEFDLD